MAKTVELSEKEYEQFKEMLANKDRPIVVQFPEAKKRTEQEQFDELMGRETEDRAGKARYIEEHTKRVPCKTDEGTSFTAIVVPSRTHKTGRVVRLDDYKFPADIEVPQAQGGKAPDNMRIRHKDGAHTKEFKHLLWSNDYQADLRQYVGREASRLPIVQQDAPASPAVAAE